MDFFEQQDRARKKTWKLILLYVTAVILIILSVYLIAAVLFGYTNEPMSSGTGRFWHPGLFLTISSIMILVIVAGTLFRIASLRSGGAAVAEMLGGRKVEPSTREPREQRLINIVEEMAIASGLPVPDIYLLDREEGINAFAAGFSVSDAAVGVTRGALEQLDRDELQGVIAHEFSHIFNGDMRINIRLIGILNGILLLHVAGLILMRSSFYAGAAGGRVRTQNRGQGGNATLAIVLFGLALMAIGYIGMIFGRLIQAAISRQREYLADAAAVQYTRNPEGLAGALRKIARSTEKGKIRDGHAVEMSHLFFASSYKSLFDRLISTHPPIEKRIRAIDPASEIEDKKQRQRIDEQMKKRRTAPMPAAAPFAGASRALSPESLVAAIGAPGHTLIPHSRKLREEIPPELIRAAHEPLEAEALIYALLLTERDPSEALLATRFRKEPDNILIKELLKHLEGSPRKWFLPLAEIALPTLRTMSPDQYDEFRSTIIKLVMEDGKVTLFEFSLQKMILCRLDPWFSRREPVRIRHHHLKTLRNEISVLLSAFAWASRGDRDAAWQAGRESIQDLLPGKMELLPREKCGIEQVNQALEEFSASSNPVKKRIITAAAHSALSDQRVTLEELELLRALSDVLECPMPPLPDRLQETEI